MRIVYSISFQFGRIWTKLTDLTLVALKLYFSMMKSWKKSNLRLLKSSVRIYAHSLFHFIPIWTNLNETNLPYSCSIEMLSLNDERLKKWNPSLLKSSMRIYSILFQFGRIWTKLTYLTHVASKWYFTMIKSWKNEIWDF